MPVQENLKDKVEEIEQPVVLDANPTIVTLTLVHEGVPCVPAEIIEAIEGLYGSKAEVICDDDHLERRSYNLRIKPKGAEPYASHNLRGDA